VKFRLERGDISNPLWLKLAKYAEQRLDVLRRDNDDTSGTDDAVKTARRRGRIDQLKELLALAKQE
jgi:hypothetical protein